MCFEDDAKKSCNLIYFASDPEARENALDMSRCLDLILMPGLGFSTNGRRLGRGKGYYDHYLIRCKRQCSEAPFTLGIAFAAQRSEEIPVTELDISVDQVIFPNIADDGQ